VVWEGEPCERPPYPDLGGYDLGVEGPRSQGHWALPKPRLMRHTLGRVPAVVGPTAAKGGRR